MKLCTGCNQEKEDHDFSKRVLSVDGKVNWCKSCYSDYRRKDVIFKRKKEEENLASHRRWYGDDEESILI